MRLLLSLAATVVIFWAKFVLVYNTERPTVLFKPYFFGKIAEDGYSLFGQANSVVLRQANYYDLGLIIPAVFLLIVFAFFYNIVFTDDRFMRA